MSKGQKFHTAQVGFLAKEITYADEGITSLGWLPARSTVIGSGMNPAVAFDSGTSDAADLGFRNSAEGHTDDDDAFSETAFDLTALGHITGDVDSTANLYFDDEAEVILTYTSTGTAPTAGRALFYVQYVWDPSDSLVE